MPEINCKYLTTVFTNNKQVLKIDKLLLTDDKLISKCDNLILILS